MTFDPFLLFLAALVAYRISILITEDVIMEPLREFWLRRFPTSDFYYDEKHVRPTVPKPDKDGNNREPWEGKVHAFPFIHRNVILVDGVWVPTKTFKTGTLVECFYCISVWVAFVVTVFTYLSTGFEFDSQFWLNFFGIAAGAEIINNVASR